MYRPHRHGEAFRAARLVVDTGIHHERWTFDQAVAHAGVLNNAHLVVVRGGSGAPRIGAGDLPPLDRTIEILDRS